MEDKSSSDRSSISINPRAIFMEFLGTFSLIFMGGWSVFAAEGKPGVLIAALTHGSILGIMVYIGLLVSGAHYNPAVTVALAATRNIDAIAAVLYIIA